MTVALSALQTEEVITFVNLVQTRLSRQGEPRLNAQERHLHLHLMPDGAPRGVRIPYSNAAAVLVSLDGHRVSCVSKADCVFIKQIMPELQALAVKREGDIHSAVVTFRCATS